LNNVRNGVTGETGELKLERIKPGSYSVRVRTVGYQDWGTRYILIRPQAETSLNVKQTRTTDQAVLHYQKGDALRDGGNHEEAVAEYKQALQINPRLAAAAIACARSLIAMQQLEDAESMLQKASKLGAAGQLAETETVFGNLRRSQELLDESISHYRRAVVLARGVSPEAHIGLALALEEKGTIDEAIAHFRQGLAQDMDTEPILYYLLGKALEKHGRNKEAIEAYSGYLRLDPNGQYSSAVESIIEQLKGK
jgi:tetratricopeptide (TPR) repeat protein